jgi:hypothetical protein
MPLPGVILYFLSPKSYLYNHGNFVLYSKNILVVYAQRRLYTQKGLEYVVVRHLPPSEV